MQVKVVIGTISFMLTMIIFGFAALLEPARLQETTEAFEGRQIENGAALFHSSCAECHGESGMGPNDECFNAAGEEVACIGRALNSADLLCTDASGKSLRMTQLRWEGSQEDLIFQTIAAGRVGTEMPTWSEEYGGPMEEYQLEQLTSFVLNWKSPELCGEVVVEAPTAPEVWPESVEELPEGDAASGADVYANNGCAGCHGDPAEPGTNGVGPHLGDIGVVGAERIEGTSAAEYVYESILEPNAFIAPECPTGPCNEPSGMNPNFGDVLSEQNMADLIAYLLSFSE